MVTARYQQSAEARERRIVDWEELAEERAEELQESFLEESNEVVVWRWQCEATHEQLQEGNRYSEEFSEEANVYIQTIEKELESARHECATARAETQKMEGIVAELAVARPPAITVLQPGLSARSVAPLSQWTKRVVNPLTSVGYRIGAAGPVNVLQRPAVAAPVTGVGPTGYPTGSAPWLIPDPPLPPPLFRPPGDVAGRDFERLGGVPPLTSRPAPQTVQAFNIASNDSEDEDEACMRRRTTVKEMKVDPLTSAAGLRK